MRSTPYLEPDPFEARPGTKFGRKPTQNSQNSSNSFYYIELTLGFSMHGLWTHRTSSMVWAWAAAGAAQIPNMDDFRSAQKPCIENPSLELASRRVFFVYFYFLVDFGLVWAVRTT